MKSLKQICKSSLTHPLYEVSILADIDDQINAYDNSVTDRIEKWIKENYDCTGLKILDNPNKNGLYEVSACDVEVKNKSITSLTNGIFEWKKINNFYCSKCTSLESLEGAPEKVGGSFDCSKCKKLSSLKGAPNKVGLDFNCSDCTSLASLKGAPEKVGREFYCVDCTKLESLEYAPEKVGKDFICSFCPSLESLEGAPQKVGGYFDCSYCIKLESLEGAPQEVGGEFRCYNCKTEFTKDDVRKVSDVKGKIVVK